MSKVLTDPAYYAEIANAIRAKTGKTGGLKPSEMATEIAGITTGGGSGSAAAGGYNISVLINSDGDQELAITDASGGSTDVPTTSLGQNTMYYGISSGINEYIINAICEVTIDADS